MYYKISKGVEYDDRTWDKINWGRCARSSKGLIEVLKTYEMAKRCLDEIREGLEKQGLNWTLETILKHSHDWILSKGEKNERKVRQRFLDAVAQQRSNNADKTKGTLISAGEVLDSLRNLKVIGDAIGSQDGSTDNDDGKLGA